METRTLFDLGTVDAASRHPGSRSSAVTEVARRQARLRRLNAVRRAQESDRERDRRRAGVRRRTRERWAAMDPDEQERWLERRAALELVRTDG
jgi:hypothetical protein